MYHTIGQRQGLGIGGLAEFGDEPWYVAEKDLSRNVLIAVQGKNHPLLFSRGLVSGPIDWVAGEPPAQQFRCKRSEEHTSELQSRPHLVCRLLLEKKKTHQ